MVRCLLVCVLFLTLSAASGCTLRARLGAADIDALTGTPWVGTLTYLDYTSKEPTTIDSSLIVRRTSDDPPAWAFGYGYSKEPHADSTSTLVLRDDGREFGDERVVSILRVPRGIRYTTESRGDDDGKPAAFRFEHMLTEHEFSLRKLVRFDGSDQFIERHVYRWSR